MKKIGIGIAVGLSVAVIVLLVVFSDRLAALMPGVETPTGKTKSENSLAELTMESDEMVYNGSTPFYVMNGIKATDVDGSDLTAKVSASVTDGALSNEKIIKYAVYDSEGILHKCERTLKLEDYDGPSLSVPESISLKYEDLEDLAEYMLKNQLVTADNGYGTDIKEKLQYELLPLAELGYYQIRFTVYNEFSDGATAECMAYVEDDVREEENIPLFKNCPVRRRKFA